jgi:hypothetical protein
LREIGARNGAVGTRRRGKSRARHGSNRNVGTGRDIQKSMVMGSVGESRKS